MSYATPSEFRVTSPILLDEKIDEIQVKLGELSWLTKSFARAYRMFKDKDGTRVSYPAVFQSSTTDYVNVFPNDNYAAHSFIYVRQPQRLVMNTQGWHGYQADIAIIVFFRLDEINTTKGYPFIEELKYDVVNKLDEVEELTINEVYDEIEDAYADFSVAAIESEYLKDDTGAMRFECTINYENNCEIENTY